MGIVLNALSMDMVALLLEKVRLFIRASSQMEYGTTAEKKSAAQIYLVHMGELEQNPPSPEILDLLEKIVQLSRWETAAKEILEKRKR